MPGTECVSSANGYYTDECFEKYIDFLLDESKGGIPNDGRWRILIVDGYGSHTMVPSVLQKLSDRKIWMITMPSHTSHALQPLDVSCFRPTKYFWSCSLRHLYGIGAFHQVNKHEAPYYFDLALQFGCSPATVASGFEATGLYPFNRRWPEENKEKFSMADTLDSDKMNGKIASTNAKLTFVDAHKSFVHLATEVDTKLDEAGDALKAAFPALAAVLKKQHESRGKIETSFYKG